MTIQATTKTVNKVIGIVLNISSVSPTTSINFSKLEAEVKGLPKCFNKVMQLDKFVEGFLNRFNNLRQQAEAESAQLAGKWGGATVHTKGNAVSRCAELTKLRNEWYVLKAEAEISYTSMLETRLKEVYETFKNDGLTDEKAKSFIEVFSKKQPTWIEFDKALQFEFDVTCVNLDEGSFDPELYEVMGVTVQNLKESVMTNMVTDMIRAAGEVYETISKNECSAKSEDTFRIHSRTTKKVIALTGPMKELGFLHPNIKEVGRQLEKALVQFQETDEALRGHAYFNFRELMFALKEGDDVWHKIRNNLPLIESEPVAEKQEMLPERGKMTVDSLESTAILTPSVPADITPVTSLFERDTSPVKLVSDGDMDEKATTELTPLAPDLSDDEEARTETSFEQTAASQEEVELFQMACF
ncbi:MAG: hypothetical protein V3T17_02960 [Pseudomonadales bacterium]